MARSRDPRGSLVRRMGRALVDGSEWRKAGRSEYAFATSGIAGLGGGLALRVVVAALALLMVPLAITTLLLPIRPDGPVAIAAYLGASFAAAGLGVWWLRRPHPSWRDAIVFVAGSDVLLLISSLSQAGIGGIGSTMFFGMLAMLVAFLLGWRILLLHCLFSAATIAAVTVVTMRVDDLGFGALYPIVAPAATIAIALPILVQFVVEAGRRGIGRLTSERDHDTLTGLYSRRGVDLALRRRLRGRTGHVAVVAVLDLDGFQALVETHGHLAGDQQLIDTALTLRAGLGGRPLLGHLGGDEFLVVGTGDSKDAAALVDDLRKLVTPRGGGSPRIAGSVGAALVPGLDPSLLSQSVTLAHAALYEARAGRTRRIVVTDPTGVVQ